MEQTSIRRQKFGRRADGGRWRDGSARWSSRTGSGWSLTEVLVVVGILAILLAILLPMLGRVREEARKITCASDLRNWGQAFSMYGSDNNNQIPYNGPPKPEEGIPAGGADLPGNSTIMRDFMLQYLAPLRRDALNPENSVLFCPSDDFSFRQDPDAIYTNALIGYHVIVGRSTDNERTVYDPVEWATKSRLDGPFAQTPLVADHNQRFLADGAEQAMMGEWAVSSHAGSGGIPQGSSFLFEDGRVRWHNQEEISQAARADPWLYYYYIDIPGLALRYE